MENKTEFEKFVRPLLDELNEWFGKYKQPKVVIVSEQVMNVWSEHALSPHIFEKSKHQRITRFLDIPVRTSSDLNNAILKFEIY